MIEKVEIRNFQSHKNTTLELVPGTNVIIGASDAGKSAIFRAINWLVRNRPLGEDFRSRWGGETSVSLQTNNQINIERIRDSGKNDYILDDITLKSFGADIPSEVAQALEMDEFNVQAQMEPPFLLANTPGESAKLLNKAASIDEIDIVISKLKRKGNSIKTEIEHMEKDNEKLMQQLSFFSGLDEIEEKLVDVEEQQKEVDMLTSKTQKLKKLIHNIVFCAAQLEKLDFVPEAVKQMQEVEKIEKQDKNLIQHIQSITNIISSIKSIQQNLSGANIEKGIEDVRVLEKTLQGYNKEENKRNNLIKRIKQYQQAAGEIEKLEELIMQQEKEIKKLTPEFCPLCGARMEEKNEKN